MEVAQRAMMRSGWQLVSTVSVEVDVYSPGLGRGSLRLGPGGSHPDEVRRRTYMDLALMQGLLWLERSIQKEKISLIGFQ